MTKVSVVVLNWNLSRLTVECLESIKDSTIDGFTLGIIVVDNASEKSTKTIEEELKKIKKQKKIKTEFIRNSSNLGFAGGNNIGITYALKDKADFVTVLNNDTRVDGNLFVNLLKGMNKYEKAGVVSPKIYFEKGYEFHKERYKPSDKGKVIWCAGGEIDWANVMGKNMGVNEVDEGFYDKDKIIDFASGTCMFLRRDAIMQSGLFDEKYFMYLEDADLCIRLKKTGWESRYVHKAFLWHKVAQSSSIGGDLNDYFITRNRMLFGIRYAPLRAKAALIKESMKILIKGRKWQKKGIRDYYKNNLGKGSWV